MPALVAGIHDCKPLTKQDVDGNGTRLAEFRVIKRRKSGKPRLAVTSPAMTISH